MKPVDQGAISVPLHTSPSSAHTPATLPAGAMKLPGQAGWISPQGLNWLKEGPHAATGQAILNAIQAKNIFPQSKNGKAALFNAPAVLGKDGKTLRPVLSFSAPAEQADESTELSLDHVHLQGDDGHQEQWSAPQTGAKSNEHPILAAHSPRAKFAAQAANAALLTSSAPTGMPRPELGGKSTPLNSLVMGLQNLSAKPQGMAKKRRNAPSFAAGVMSTANKRAKHATSLPAALQGKKLAFSAERFGNGSNGVVCGLTVDGQVSNDFVVKTALMQGDQPSEATMDMLRKEIGLNEDLSRINGLKPMPGILVGAGSAELENQLCLVLPRIHGEPLAKRIDTLYDDCVAGNSSPESFVQNLRNEIKPSMQGMSVLHDHDFIVNDFNAGNLLHDSVAKHGKLIDFGCAGRSGDFVKPGTVGTIAPERIESSEHRPDSPGSRNKPLMPESDAYSMGCVLHFLVHGRYPSWSDKAAGMSDEQQLHELSASSESFLRRGSLFPNGQVPLNSDLRGDSAAEKQLREHLNASGFYELVEGLTRPDPEKRLTMAQALDSRFLNPAPTAIA